MWSAFAHRRMWPVLPAAAVVVLTLSGITAVVLLADDTPSGNVGNPPAMSPAGSGFVSAASSAGSGPSQRGSAGRTTAPAAPTSTPTKAAGSVLVRWIRKFAPTGGGGGAVDDAYREFMNRDCVAALSIARTGTADETIPEPYRTLYEGAAAACLAVLDGRTEHWQIAIDRFPAVDLANLDCWHLEIYTVFRDLVEAGRANRRATVDGGAAAASRCPELIRLEPDRGKPAGGYSVTVVGRNFPPTLDLIWMELEVTVTARRVSDNLMTMVVPDASATTFADIEIRIADAPRMDGPYYASFTYAL